MDEVIDLEKKVYFYDDRSKTKAVGVMDKVLWQGSEQVLAQVQFNGAGPWEIVLFDRSTRDVLSINLPFWKATNQDPDSWRL